MVYSMVHCMIGISLYFLCRDIDKNNDCNKLGFARQRLPKEEDDDSSSSNWP